jgi:hypothetical protein
MNAGNKNGKNQPRRRRRQKVNSQSFAAPDRLSNVHHVDTKEITTDLNGNASFSHDATPWASRLRDRVNTPVFPWLYAVSLGYGEFRWRSFRLDFFYTGDGPLPKGRVGFMWSTDPLDRSPSLAEMYGASTSKLTTLLSLSESSAALTLNVPCPQIWRNTHSLSRSIYLIDIPFKYDFVLVGAEKEVATIGFVRYTYSIDFRHSISITSNTLFQSHQVPSDKTEETSEVEEEGE